MNFDPLISWLNQFDWFFLLLCVLLLAAAAGLAFPKRFASTPDRRNHSAGSPPVH